MAVKLVLAEENWRDFLPLTWTRPVWELRMGAVTLGERAQRFWGLEAHFFPDRDWLPCREDIPRDGEIILSRADILPEEPRPDLAPGEALFSEDGEAIAVRTTARELGAAMEDLAAGARARITTKTRVIGKFWNLIAFHPGALRADLEGTRPGVRGQAHPTVTLLGDVFVAEGAEIDPGAVLDGREGPVFVDKGTRVMSHAFVQGPAYLGPKCLIKAGARLYEGVSLGPVCKVGGELEEVIFQGYSNKQHEGFLGHAFVGEWVNLGAGTEVSDLKNTYGPVKAYLGGELVDTGLSFLGPVLGDHSKTGINVALTTGAVVGVFANMFGSGVSPKFIPSFTWGYPDFSEYRLEKALEVAARVMARRGVEMTPVYEAMIREIFELTRGERA